MFLFPSSSISYPIPTTDTDDDAGGDMKDDTASTVAAVVESSSIARWSCRPIEKKNGCGVEDAAAGVRVTGGDDDVEAAANFIVLRLRDDDDAPPLGGDIAVYALVNSGGEDMEG